ncbi:unnamed protein product, partial [Candidula unifasciata]
MISDVEQEGRSKLFLDQVQTVAVGMASSDRREMSVDSDDEVWKRRSVSDNKVEEEKSSQLSPLTSHLRSLDLSGAREYLLRQFEDEIEPAELPGDQEKHSGIAGKSPVDLETVQSEISETSYADVFSHSYSMLAQ